MGVAHARLANETFVTQNQGCQFGFFYANFDDFGVFWIAFGVEKLFWLFGIFWLLFTI